MKNDMTKTNDDVDALKLKQSSMFKKVPFNKPYFVGTEFELMKQAISNGHISGCGPFTKKVERLLETLLDVPRVLMTTSCTHALEMTAQLLNLGPNDEVIIPSYTFVSTVNAFISVGAKPVFCDIREDTLNLDENLVKDLITAKTKAIVPVHYGGVGCDMAAIMALAQQYGLAVIEDNAHGLFGTFRGRNLGTFGDFGTLSFHETKNISCGEGGALIINKPEHVARAEIILEKGTNRKKFFRGEVDKYTWVDRGSSYTPSDLLMSFLLGQLNARKTISELRSNVWRRYNKELSSWAQTNNVRLPFVPEDCMQSHHLFYLIMPSAETRDRLLEHLNGYGIGSVCHYMPLHSSLMGARYGGEKGDCPKTESMSECLLRLPFYNSLTEQDQNFVIQCVLEFSVK